MQFRRRAGRAIKAVDVHVNVSSSKRAGGQFSRPPRGSGESPRMFSSSSRMGRVYRCR